MTLLAGPVAKKKKPWKEDNELKKITQKLDFRTYFFYVNDVLLLKNGAAVDLLHPSCCKVV